MSDPTKDTSPIIAHTSILLISKRISSSRRTRDKIVSCQKNYMWGKKWLDAEKKLSIVNRVSNITLCINSRPCMKASKSC